MLGHYRARPSSQSTANKQIWLVLALGLVAGYLLGMVIMETADVMYTTKLKNHQDAILAAGADETVSPIPTTVTTTEIDSIRPAQLPDRTTTPSTTSSSSSSSSTTSSTTSNIGQKPVEKPEGHTVHSLLTSNGSPYQNFQGRIMYGTYKLVQKMPGGEKLTGFTRILHRMTDDGLMDEIPTFRAVPLHPECDTYCDFPVADRPNAVQQWITAVDKDPSLLKGAWVFLLEGDYVWMKPIQAPDAYSNAPGMQFHYDYIQPQYPGVTECLTRLMKLHDLSPAPKDKDAPIPASGPAPALLRFWQLKQITPFWELMTKAIEDDKDAVKLLGWIREMYAWDVGVLLTGAKMMVTEEPGVTQLLAQPPHDTKVGNASLCHYTWGAIYNDTTGEVWRWEKRDYTAPQLALKVPRIPMPPQPFKPNTWHLQDRLPVTQELHETLTAMLGQMNKAIDNLADLTSKARRR